MQIKNRNDVWLSIVNESKKTEDSIKDSVKKRTGSYYTDFELADSMVMELISKVLNDGKDISKLKFLEPCVGTGNFVFSYLKIVSLLDLKKNQIVDLINNIYVADINSEALEQYKKSFSRFVDCFFGIRLDNDYFKKHISNGLLFNITQKNIEYIGIKDAFSSLDDYKFDIIITNPPYKILKAERGNYKSLEEFNYDKLIYAQVSVLTKEYLYYSSKGTLNLYKLFVEEIIDKYSNNEAYISLLLPASILSDKSCEALRTHIIHDLSIESVKVMDENCPYVNAQQALCSLFVKKGVSTKRFLMYKDYYLQPEKCVLVDVNTIVNNNNGNCIFALNQQEYSILKKLQEYPTVRSFSFIHNLRGELDLTINKNSIVEHKTPYPLLRGRNIGYYNLIDLNGVEYVDEGFVNLSKKKSYIKDERIICQQIVNMKKERRVAFTYIEKNYVLGNSCNFISVDNNDYGVDLFALLGLFNSSLINWYFKLTSSNNHINNYEIDNFPIPISDIKALKKISRLTKEYLKTNDGHLLEKIDKLVYAAFNIENDNEESDKIIANTVAVDYYNSISNIIPQFTLQLAKDVLEEKSTIESTIIQLGITLDDFLYKTALAITDKYIKISKNIVLNHITFKLSDLDMEMISSVPQGGSWKDIPQETVKKSKRLERITKTGGRTTLYGRIDYSKPSYTITTYFNRPGNGTYVHPIHNRVLSVREAARFQSFKDDYYFYGNKTQLLKQVGNAVPTLLAYQLGKTIKEKTGCCKSVDLFCGAGGMTIGFKEAGITSVISNDIEQSACITLKTNNPEIPVLCGDVTTDKVKDAITKSAIKNGADIICGGPPCQGFSMAGFRSKSDPRNQLFRDFVEIVKRINPKVIVFENVEGLLSYQSGSTYNEVHKLFSELGYNTEGRTLLTSEYAVPQKRRRVIIICTQKELKVHPSDLFPSPITIDEQQQVNAFDTISDLENVNCGEEAQYITTSESDIVRFFKGKVSYERYISGRANMDILTDCNISLITTDNYQLTLYEQKK